MQRNEPSPPSDLHTAGGELPGWRRALWLALLVAASVFFSLGFACVTPLAAFAAAGALTLPRRDALLLIAAVWLANQLCGFGFLAYPWTADTLAWGMVLGITALLATLAGQSILHRLGKSGTAIVLIATFGGAFVVYQGGLYVAAAALLGGTENFAPAIVAQVFAVNAAAFVAFLGLHRLAMRIGLASHPGIRLFQAAQ